VFTTCPPTLDSIPPFPLSTLLYFNLRNAYLVFSVYGVTAICVGAWAYECVVMYPMFLWSDDTVP
jgi:hypothetical protein